ncbi:MAG TPA: carboxypeptidase-like regulatory domain-containing protein [Vicinamibacterales bacterium]|nr:carboxypeptidase-like regulatory domain-containing protein [Vicinamibacterales bacterium]
MRLRLHGLAAGLLATLTAGLLAQAQTSKPTFPTGAPTPGIPEPQAPRQTSPQAPRTGIIRGRVLRLDSGQPLGKVRVDIRATGVRDLPTAMTDEKGQYELKALPAARYTLSAYKGGFVTLEYGQRRPNEPGRPVDLADGEVLDRIDFSLSSGGVIAGTVLDDAGEPMAGAVVQALRPRYVKGIRQVSPGPSRDVTDDLGQFRLFGLAPGSYVVSATASDGRSEVIRLAAANSVGSVATYYPGTLIATDARPVQVEAGAEISGLSFAIVPARLASITGTVRTADGKVPVEATLTLAQSVEGGTSTRGAAVKPDGSFSIPSLPAGRYTLTARLPPPSDQIAMTDVTVVNADVTAALTLRKGDTARGRITFDAAAATADLQPSQVRVIPDAVGASLMTLLSGVTVRDDWTFEIPALVGRRRLRVTVPQGWAVRSIRRGGADVTDSTLDFAGKDIDGIVVQLTKQLTTVAGQVTDARGQKVTDATVVVFAEDRDRWGPNSRFVRAARPDQDGRFSIQGLPAARYLAVALDFLEAGEETDPDALERLQRLGTRLTLGDAESKTVDLKVSPAP